MEDNKEQNADESTSRSSSDKEYEWSNMKCIELAFEDNFPTAVRDINVQKGIINRFFNFYLGTKRQKGLNVTDLVFSTIAIMPLHKNTEEFIWHPDNYDINGTLFFLSAEDRLNAEINDLKEKIEVERTVEETVQSGDDIDETEKEINESDNNNDESHSQEQHQSVNEANKTETKQKEENETKNTHEPEISETKETMHAEMNNKRSILPKIPTDILWYGNKNKRYEVTVENVRLTYGPKENSAFSASCSKLLEEWDNNAKGRIALKYFFGIVALILMRACTKTYMNLVHTFASSKFREFVSFIKGYFSYSVPQKKCVKSCYRTFNKRVDKTVTMFAKIVMNSFYIDKLRQDDGYSNLAINIFKYTLLSHTAGHGFGLVTMLHTLKNYDLVIKVTYCEETAESWHKLKNFLEKYMTKTSKERTHHWARVINSNYFKDLSCSSNYALAVILAVFIEKINKNPGIWESTWVKRADNLEKYKQLGYVMYEKYVKTENDSIQEMCMQFSMRSKSELKNDFLSNIFENFDATLMSELENDISSNICANFDAAFSEFDRIDENDDISTFFEF